MLLCIKFDTTKFKSIEEHVRIPSWIRKKQNQTKMHTTGKNNLPLCHDHFAPNYFCTMVNDLQRITYRNFSVIEGIFWNNIDLWVCGKPMESLEKVISRQQMNKCTEEASSTLVAFRMSYCLFCVNPRKRFADIVFLAFTWTPSGIAVWEKVNFPSLVKYVPLTKYHERTWS